ncbi:hypothetical protein DPMN_133534 [Dreissena polymorpha]|uniref:Uncharacterized protein n=1 Tax=Dreissena polymorpha TaxID=45954 RepID=A0A9D4JEW9_DREPO|nr:hypothetical protein DPMN_133534 [Dreissena polymorpha]
MQLEHDNVVITRTEEIVAIEQTLQATREASATLEQGLEQSSDDVDVQMNKLQQLKRMETKQKLNLKQRTESSQDMCSKTQVFLSEHSLLMGSDSSTQ